MSTNWLHTLCCLAQIVKELVVKGAPLDDPDENGITPVLKAALQGHRDVLATLLEQKVVSRFSKVDTRNSFLLLVL